MVNTFDGVKIDPPVPNRIQFARLLWALKFVLASPDSDRFEMEGVVDRLANLTCMTVPEVREVLSRADSTWKDIRDQSTRGDLIEAIRQEAAEIFEDEGVIEVDPDAEVIECDGADDGKPGSWVQAWVWVDADVKKNRCLECGEEYPEAGDGWNGRCPTCADKEEKRNQR